MRVESGQLRRRLTLSAVGLYLLPLLALAFFSAIGWKTFSLGLLLTIGGTLFLFTLLQRWEASIYDEEEAPTLQQDPTHDWVRPLPVDRSLELVKQEHVRELQRYEEVRKESDQHIHTLTQELTAYQNTSTELLQQRDRALQEHQRTIDEQKALIELQKQQMADLTSREQDLKYEIKTLLQLSNIDPHALDSQDATTPTGFKEPAVVEQSVLPEITVHNSESAKQQLRRCLDIAAKITTSSPAMGEQPGSEIRRLFDALNGENRCAVLFYSPKDTRLLFANGQIKRLLGWVPDIFLQQFPKIIEPGAEYWKLALSQLTQQPESQITLPCKSSEGPNRQLKCHLGVVSSGFFRHHIVAVLY